jgi:hypothetical protein
MAPEAKVAAALLLPAVLWGATEEGVKPRAATTGAPSAVTLRVTSDEGGEISLLSPEGRQIKVEDLLSAGCAKPYPELVVSLEPTGHYLTVRTLAKQSVVVFDNLAGFETLVPTASVARFQIRRNQEMVQVVSGGDNSGPLTFRFPDGGHAEVRGLCTNRFDLFRDGSYTFCSTGSGEATNADGLPRAILPSHSMLHGGPLARVPAPHGPARMQRLTPLVEVMISGHPHHGVHVRAGGTNLALAPNGKSVLTLPNGARVDFAVDATGDSLEWVVFKGEFSFRIDGLPAARIRAMTHQRAMIVWRPNDVVRIKNLSIEGDLLASLPDGSLVSVLPHESYDIETRPRQTRETPQRHGEEAGLSRLVVFFELPIAAEGESPSRTPDRGGGSRDGSAYDSRPVSSEDRQAFADNELATKRGALLAPENRPDLMYASTTYSLLPRRGRLMAPRIFQPPATGF